MPASPLDSTTYGSLWGDPEISRLFSDTAEVRAMLVVEGALAKAQGALGMIPERHAQTIQRAALDVAVDPGKLKDATGSNGVPVPALVKAFREAMGDETAAAFAHWGATSQDIVDTGLVLRLRQVIGIFEDRLGDLLGTLAALAETHAETPMAGRTWGMAATPTSLGAVIASWGNPLLDALDRLDALKPRLLCVSLSGAAGTLSAMGPDGPEVRAELAAGLGLRDPDRSTHSTRDAIVEFGGWMSTTLGALAKLGEDVLSLTRAGEARLEGSGASSTMPQKQNPVAPSALVALSRLVVGLNASLGLALPHRDQRDGTAWMTEWLVLPQLCHATGRGLTLATSIAEALSPDREALLRAIDPDGLGLIYAEALSFAIAQAIPRPEAQAKVKAMTTEARASGSPLPVLAAARWPMLNLDKVTTPEAQLGDAPGEADRFVRAVEERL